MQSLYLIKCQQYYKIGVAADVESRLAQLSTGNPFPLEVETVYTFDNAEVVERAIHQKLKSKRVRGEWFELSYDDTVEIHQLCLLLGGSAFEYRGANPDEDAIEEAEEAQDVALDNVDKWDYAAMFADGWRMEIANKNGVPRNWSWRRGGRGKRETIYGGSVKTLPLPIEEMRYKYRDSLAQLKTKEAEAQ